MDTIDSKARSENMRAIKSKNMNPEMKVRKLVHSLGYRYRLHKKSLPGTPDLVFASRQKAIFVHGCFWHQHNAKKCKITRLPKSNLSYWKRKLDANVKRDKKNILRLRRKGWKVMVIWECQIRDLDRIEKRIQAFLED